MLAGKPASANQRPAPRRRQVLHQQQRQRPRRRLPPNRLRHRRAAPTTAPAQVGAAPPPVAKPGVAVSKDDPAIAALYAAAQKEGKVSWWDQHDQDVAQKFIDAFQKQFPGVNVEFFEGTQDVLKARSIQEARAGRVSFDFIDTGQNWPDYQSAGIVDSNTDFTDLLARAGVDKTFIVDGTYSPEFNVYGSAYNTDMVKAEELPDSTRRLQRPEVEGQPGHRSAPAAVRLRHPLPGRPRRRRRHAASPQGQQSTPD